MLELPEAAVIAEQCRGALADRTVAAVEAGHSPHKWAWFYGDPADYPKRLVGEKHTGAVSWGGLVDLDFGGAHLYIGDGTNLRFFPAGAALPTKHQLRIDFDDGAVLIGSVQMYGALWVCPTGELPSRYLAVAMEKPSPLSDSFDREYFDSLFAGDTQKLSLKGFLATEQRIPGLGNGVLQDILFNAHSHPKRKVDALTDTGRTRLFESLKDTLHAMREAGGRDTETLLDGRPGGYETVLSRKTGGRPCPVCGESIQKASYMGGSVYYCPDCQPE